jgi:hypothetical protein
MPTRMLLTLLLLNPIITRAGVYRWVDEQGNMLSEIL